MNNEPVAYRWKWDAGLEWHYADYYTDRDYFKLEPLYTHPVEEQDESFDRTASHMAGEYVSYKAELTDEIVALLEGIDKEQNTETGWWETSTGAKFGADILEKIKELLRKASEK